MPADWWPSFLVFSPANMTVFSVAFLSHAEMTFVYQEYSVYICTCVYVSLTSLTGWDSV